MSYIVLNSAAELEYEAFQPLVARWFTLKEAGGIPTPAKLFEGFQDDIAEYKMQARVAHNPLDVAYTHAGATLEALYGKPLAGKNLSELYNDWFRKRAYEGYRLCAETRMPVYDRRTLSTVVVKIGYHKIHLPLDGGSAGGEINDVLTYIIPLDRSWKKREDWEKLIKLTPWF